MIDQASQLLLLLLLLLLVLSPTSSPPFRLHSFTDPDPARHTHHTQLLANLFDLLSL
jgi:hypothetical protein